MELIIIGLFVNVLTWVGKKLHLSGTYVAVFLSILGGAIYYFLITFHPTVWKELLKSITLIFGYSQLVYGALKKLGILGKDQ